MLEFKSKPISGEQARVFFPNGYGVSVITGEGSYSDKDRPYEVAILKGNEENNIITYSTYITDDVIGWQTISEVEDIMVKVSEL